MDNVNLWKCSDSQPNWGKFQDPDPNTDTLFLDPQHGSQLLIDSLFIEGGQEWEDLERGGVYQGRAWAADHAQLEGDHLWAGSSLLHGKFMPGDQLPTG